MFAMNSDEVRVGSCILACDMAPMVRFHKDILGLQTDWDGGNFAEFKTASGSLSFWLYSRKEFVMAFGETYVPPQGMNQSFELALWLPTYAAVDTEYERLLRLGLSFPSGKPITYSFGIRNFYVSDPEGNLIEIGSINK